MANEKGKNAMARLAKQQLCTCITLFCTFLCRRCTNTTWNVLWQDVNTRKRISFYFSELAYGALECNFRKFTDISDKLRTWWNTLVSALKFEIARNNLSFKWRFRSRRCRLSSSRDGKERNLGTRLGSALILDEAGVSFPYPPLPPASTFLNRFASHVFHAYPALGLKETELLHRLGWRTCLPPFLSRPLPSASPGRPRQARSPISFSTWHVTISFSGK